MARPTRPKSRTLILAEVNALAKKAQAALVDIDLRTTRGELREAIKAARTDAENLAFNTGVALEHDLPAAPLQRVHAV